LIRWKLCFDSLGARFARNDGPSGVMVTYGEVMVAYGEMIGSIGNRAMVSLAKGRPMLLS